MQQLEKMHECRPNAHAEIRANKSISYAWILARLLAQIQGKRSISDAWTFSQYLAPVRRKRGVFFAYSWGFLLEVELLWLEFVEVLLRHTFPM